MTINEGDVLWTPGSAQAEGTRINAFLKWLRERHNLNFADYQSLWEWSVQDVGVFWSAIWEFFDIQADGSPFAVLELNIMPGARWFPGVKLNYAEHVFRNASSTYPALLARTEVSETTVSWAELGRQTGALSESLRSMGMVAGDRVVSYMPNITQTVVAFLACASIGAIWSSCSPDMGASVVLDRFTQIEPKVMFAVDSYSDNGKTYDRTKVVAELIENLPTVTRIVHVAGPAFEGDLAPGRVLCLAAGDFRRCASSVFEITF